jgi:hypothetical protein
MKEVSIESIKQFERRLIIAYNFTEGYEKRNHLGQVMEVIGEAGGGQLTIDLESEELAAILKHLLEEKVQSITEGYF